MPAFAAARGPPLFPQSLHHRLLVLGAVDAPSRLGAVCRIRGRSVDGDPVRAGRGCARCAVPGRADAAPNRAAAAARRTAVRTSASPRAAHVPVHLRRVEPDRAEEPAGRRSAHSAARRCRTTPPCSSSSSRIPSTDRAGVRRLHEEAAGSNVVHARRIFRSSGALCADQLRPTAICRRTGRKDSGSTLLEAMSLGKPLIGTAYSGNMDFMTAGEQLPARLLARDPDTRLRPVPARRGVGGARRRPCGTAHPRSDSEPCGAAERGLIAPPTTSRGTGTLTSPVGRCAAGSTRFARAVGSRPARELSGRMDGSSRADAESALAQSTRLHHALAMRLSGRAARSWQRSSRKAAALHDTLALMERSAGRRMYLRVRAGAVRILLAIRHPVWTAVSLLRAVAATRAPAAARAAIRHLLHRAFPLRLVAPVAERTDQPEDFSAIRWIGPVRVRHEAMDALFCHPASSVDYRASAPSGSRFVTSLAISPNAWRHDPGPIDFRVHVQIPASGWTVSVERRLDPARRYTDRRWHHVEIELPPQQQPSIDVLRDARNTSAAGRPHGLCLGAVRRSPVRMAAADS